MLNASLTRRLTKLAIQIIIFTNFLSMIHQKTTQNAIAALSRLAELYSSGTLASSRQIAENRNLPVPLVGKILTELSRGGLIIGSPGPGGGYRMAKPPVEISLMDVVELFERESEGLCPYGPGWCGHNDPCPLHDTISAMKQDTENFLRNTNFEVFQHGEPKPLLKPTKPKK